MKRFDLTHSESNAPARAASPRKAAFMDRARKGHFGDMRLLGMCAGIVALCIVFVVIKSGAAPEPETVLDMQDAVAFTPPILAGATGEPDFAESTFDEADYYVDLEENEAPDAAKREKTPEEQERIFREMARDIPEGQTLIW